MLQVLISKLINLIKKESVNVALTDCYPDCKDVSLDDVLMEIDIKLTNNQNEMIELSSCASCIIKELVSKLNAKTYIALTPSGSTIEFYDLGKVVIEIQGEEDTIITIIPRRLMIERLLELRMQALITIDDEQNIRKLFNIT